MKPKVSIIIPTYNRCDFLGETLESIISQTYLDWQCIVVDDGSLDFTQELMGFYVAKDPRIEFHQRPSDRAKGANSCRNFGFEKSKGVFVNWFDSDDLLDPDYLHKQMDNINSGEYDGSIANFSVFQENVNTPIAKIQNKSITANILADLASGKINPAMQAIVLRRTVVNNISYNPELDWADDLEFLFKILIKQRFVFGFLEENLVFLRRHNESLTGNYNRYYLSEIKSELKVRRSIFLHVYENRYDNEVISAALDLYQRGFKMLFISQGWNQVKEELVHFRKYVSLKRSYFFWEIKLYGFHILHRFGYRNFGLQKHLGKLEFLFNKTPQSCQHIYGTEHSDIPERE